MLPAVAHLTASGFVINDHGSIHATAEEVRSSRSYYNNDLTNPTRCPGFPLALGEGKGEGPRPVNEQSTSKTLDRTNHETVQKVWADSATLYSKGRSVVTAPLASRETDKLSKLAL